MQVYCAIPDKPVSSDQGFIREAFLDRHQRRWDAIKARPTKTADPIYRTKRDAICTFMSFFFFPAFAIITMQRHWCSFAEKVQSGESGEGLEAAYLRPVEFCVERTSTGSDRAERA
jgi:hypothetical protein